MAKWDRWSDTSQVEVRDMRDAETTLGIIRERGKRGLPLEGVYRRLFNPDLYLKAYGRIYRNYGAMTKGTTNETVDGMSPEKIEAIINLIRYERYRWIPVRRVNIPKANGKMRPLGIPTWSDKLLQEVVRSILNAYYEPQFSDHSHGFRPERGCHTALREIFINWKSTRWFIEGDIKGCFGNIDHAVLLSIIREKIQDSRFLRLIEELLKAGYMERMDYRPTLSGTPQGGIVSPILANIYLDKLDKYVETVLIPGYTRGNHKRPNKAYRTLQNKLQWAAARPKGITAKQRSQFRKDMRKVGSADDFDPNFRRLRYVRYADDFLLGFDGPKAEAEEIKGKVETFLRDQLKLELSPQKTLITHASRDKARFLGHDISTYRDPTRSKMSHGSIDLRIPPEVIRAKIARYRKNGKPLCRSELEHESDFQIVTTYGAEYRGYVQYYAFTRNRFWLHSLEWAMAQSLSHTLAHKHRTTARKMARLYTTRAMHKGGITKAWMVRVDREGKQPLLARFGGLYLGCEPFAEIRDHVIDMDRRTPPRAEILQRLDMGICEMCQERTAVQVHHIRRIGDIDKPGRTPKTPWMKVMIARKRKTLVLCIPCHTNLHAGRPVPFKSPN